jgi:long-chain acyl-CoA synthetase
MENTMTFPRLLLQQAQQRAQHPAFREKDRGIWQTWSWQQTLQQVRELACGLASQGFGRGMQLAIVGDNRPRLYWAMMAAQALGGVPVPLYQEAPANDLAFVLQDAQIRFAVVEDQEQVDKMQAIREHYPDLAFIAWDKERGMRHYQGAGLLSCRQLQELGRAYDAAHPDFFQKAIEQGQPDDTAIILYTSGTTGKPKGVCQSHRALISAAKGGVQFDGLTERENILSYLPMAWVGDCLFSFAQAHVAGFTVNCPESGETVMTDMREIGPSYYFAPPRVFENMRTSLMIRMEDASPIKRKLFDFFMAHAAKVGNAILDGQAVSVSDRLTYLLGDWIIYAPLKNVLGLSRVRVAYTAGAAIGPDLFRFYRSLGINLKQLYGATETCAYVCLQPNGKVKFDSVGLPAPGVEVKLADHGEVLVRSQSVLKEYYRRPDATREVIDADGWFHTGDAGVFDSEGHLRIIDRAADVGQLNGGALFAPNYIENKLKFIPFVKEAVSFGHQRDGVCAFINIDSSAVGNWAEKRGIAWAGYAELATHPEVGKLITSHIEQMNRVLAAEPGMADTQIRRFLILHKELDPDDEELTRTRKVRRKFIAEKYAVLIDALYSDKPSQFIEIQVKYEDGRSGSVSADLAIYDLASNRGNA